MTLGELGSWLQDCIERIVLAWSRTVELLGDGRLSQLRMSDLVILGLTCLALGWFIDAAVRDREPVNKEPRRNN
jgi:hypothetical protein